MDLSFLTDYVNLIILGICLCVGAVLKNLIPSDSINRYIPLIVALLGIVLSWWNNADISPSILLEGMVSGLASTGLYEAFSNLINRNSKQ